MDQGSSIPVPPPPYTTATANIPETSDLTTSAPSASNLEGLRNSILDNIPILFYLAYRDRAEPPKDFRLVTTEVPASEANLAAHGHPLLRACVMTIEMCQKKRLEYRIFVQGPPCEGTEKAFEALLSKTQGMLGRRWEFGVLRNRRVYLED